MAEQLEMTAVRTFDSKDRTPSVIEIAILKAHEPVLDAGLEPIKERMVPAVELPPMAELNWDLTYKPAMASAVRVPMAIAMWKKFILRDAAPADGNGQPENQPPTPQPMPGPPPNPAPASPPAAEAVLNGDRSERELKLQEDLEAERAGRKKDQIRLSQLEDENQRLKSPPDAPPEDAWRWRPFKR